MPAVVQTGEKLTGTVAEAGEILGLGHNQIYEAVRRGEIPTMRVGKRIIVLWKPFMKKLTGAAA